MVSEGSGAYQLGKRPTLLTDSSPDLELTLGADNQLVGPDESVVYEVSYGNTGTTGVSNLELRVAVPEGSSFVEASDGGSLDEATSEVVWDLDLLEAGVGGKRHFSVKTAANLADGEVLVSQASFNTGGPAIINSGESVVVRDGVSLALDVTVTGDRAASGDLVFYRYVVSNPGTTSVTDVKVNALVPGATYLEHTAEAKPSPTCPNLTGSHISCYLDEWMTWELGTLASGETRIITLPIELLSSTAPPDGQPLMSRVMVSEGSGAYQLGKRPTIVASSNNTQKVVLEVADAIVLAGGTTTLKVSAGNTGDTALNNALLVVELPNELNYLSSSGTSESIGNKVYWPIGNLAAHAWLSETVSVQVDSGVAKGDILSSSVELRSDKEIGELANAGVSTIVSDSARLPIDFDISAGESGIVLDTALTNVTSSSVSDVEQSLLVPSLTSTNISSDETCPNLTGSSNQCYADEWITWDFGTLTASEQEQRDLTAGLFSTGVDEGNILFSHLSVSDSSLPNQQLSLVRAIGVGVVHSVDSNHDSDDDGIPDWWEIRWGYDRLNLLDGSTDDDGDGSDNLEEFQESTDPTLQDTDSDGILDGPDINPLNATAPIANAGKDVVVTKNIVVTLDGSSSHQSDYPTGGTNGLTFSWEQTDGIAVVLDDSTLSNPSFTSPDVAVVEELIFSLTVSDGVNVSAPDAVKVTVSSELVDLPPVADAGPDQPGNGAPIFPGDTVVLSGANSSDDVDSLDTLTFAWSETTSTGIVLPDITVLNPTFTAPSFGVAGGAVTFELTVTDSKGQSDTDTVIVNVSSLSAPVAKAGPDQSVGQNVSVTLDGSNSHTVPPGGGVSYAWNQTDGSPVTLSGADSALVTFTTPSANGALGFELVVTDGDGLKGSDSVVVNVTQDSVPVCLAGPDQTVAEFTSGVATSVSLSASSSSIVSGSLDSYLWTQISGSSVTLSTPNQVATTFTVPEVGNAGAAFEFQVTCTSNLGVSSTDTILVNVSNSNRVPEANAGDDQTVAEGQTVILSGQFSSDLDGDTLSYSWVQVGGSVSVGLDDSTSATPSFVAPDVGFDGEAISFELTVNDGNLMHSDRVIVNITHINATPVADGGQAQTAKTGDTVILDASSSSDLEGGTLSYVWKQIGGTTQVNLSNGSSVQAEFVAPAPAGGGQVEVLVFEIQVTDEGGLSATAQVEITVDNPADTPETPSEGGSGGGGGGAIASALLWFVALIVFVRSRVYIARRGRVLH